MRTGKYNLVAPVLSLGTILALLTFSASAQSVGSHAGRIAPRGVPASVTSFGFGGHPGFHGVPASVTSQNFGTNFGVRAGRPVTSLGFGAPLRIHNHPLRSDHHHHRVVLYSPFYGEYVPYAYAYPYYMSDDDSVDENAPSNEIQAQREYDERHPQSNDYRDEVNSKPEPQAQAAPQPAAAQPSTVLIFKDGHQVEIGNYAIVGATLYDLSDGRSKKVQLADLDLTATVKENDDRGVEFQLPSGTKLN